MPGSYDLRILLVTNPPGISYRDSGFLGEADHQSLYLYRAVFIPANIIRVSCPCTYYSSLCYPPANPGYSPTYCSKTRLV